MWDSGIKQYTLSSSSTLIHSLLPLFQCRVRYGSVRKGALRIAFPPPKVGVTRTEPYSFFPRLQYSVGVLTPERVPENSSYTPLIGRQNRHFRATLG